MSTPNVFDRTALFVKEEMSDGKIKITRLPWDLLSANGYPFMISPLPIIEGFDGRTQTAVYTPDVVDMLSDPDNNGAIDNVVKFEFFNSEAEFTALYDNVNAFYISDDGQSNEMGYPRS